MYNNRRIVDVYNGYIKVPVKDYMIPNEQELDIESVLYQAIMEYPLDCEFIGEVDKQSI